VGVYGSTLVCVMVDAYCSTFNVCTGVCLLYYSKTMLK